MIVYSFELVLEPQNLFIETDLFPNIRNEKLKLSVTILEEPLIVLDLVVDQLVPRIEGLLSQETLYQLSSQLSYIRLLMQDCALPEGVLDVLLAIHEQFLVDIRYLNFKFFLTAIWALLNSSQVVLGLSSGFSIHHLAHEKALALLFERR